MAAARREMREALETAVRLMGELDRAGQSERFAVVVLYVLRTQDEETLREFGAALRREVRGPGGDMKTYGEQLIQEGRLEGIRVRSAELIQFRHPTGRSAPACGPRVARQSG